MAQHINTALFREKHPASWNEVWRIIKTDAPQFAAFLRDPFLQECISTFDASIELRLADIPARAIPLIPQDVITS